MLYDPSTCYKCGSNAWTSCKHREAMREAPPYQKPYDRREAYVNGSGGGRFSIPPHKMEELRVKLRKRK